MDFWVSGYLVLKPALDMRATFTALEYFHVTE